MKWFKHFTDWHMDKDICDAVRKFGHIGYSLFIIAKELYGAYYNESDNQGNLVIELKTICERTHTKPGRMKDVLDFYVSRNRVEYKIENGYVTLKIPEFIRLISTWEKRKNNENLKVHEKKSTTEERRIEEIEERKKEEKTKDIVLGISQLILDDLNAKANKNFSDKSFIVQQIRNGKKPEDFSTIIENKIHDPFFQKNPKLFNPRTLFGDEHFDTYLNEKSKPEEREKKLEREPSEKENIPYETICKIYKAYLDTELSATQEALHYIINNYDIDDAMEEINLTDVLDEISAVSIDEKIILYTENTIGFNERRFWNLLEEKTGKDCEWQKEIPEEFLKSEFFEFYKNKVTKCLSA